MFPNFDSLHGGVGPGPVRQKEGFGKFLDIVFDNLTRLAVTGFFAIVAAIPGGLGLVFSALIASPPLLLLSGIVGGGLMGPFYGAMMDGIVLSLRGIPGSWWEHYRHALKRDGKGCILPGVVMGCLAAAAVNVYRASWSEESLPDMMLPCLVICLLIAVAFSTYFWPQRVALDLRIWDILHNCLFLIVAHPAVTLGAVVVQALYWAILFLTIPYSGVFLIITGVWLPAIGGTTIIFDSLNHDLKLEARWNDCETEQTETE